MLMTSATELDAAMLTAGIRSAKLSHSENSVLVSLVPETKIGTLAVETLLMTYRERILQPRLATLLQYVYECLYSLLLLTKSQNYQIRRVYQSFLKSRRNQH